MARRVKPYFFPARWMMIGGFRFAIAGEKSRLGEESLEDGLEEREWGDIGLANGEHVWWSTVMTQKVGKN